MDRLLTEEEARAYAEEILRNLPIRGEPATPPESPSDDGYRSVYLRQVWISNDLRVDRDKWKREADEARAAIQPYEANFKDLKYTAKTWRESFEKSMARVEEIQKENERLAHELEIFRSIIADGNAKLKTAGSDMDLVMKQRDEYVEKYNALLKTIQSA